MKKVIYASTIDKFPDILTNAITGLNNSNRQKILLILFDENKLSFTELVGKTGMSDSLLPNHLKILKDSALIEQVYEREISTDSYSFYKLTQFGRRIMNAFLGTYYVVVKKKRTIEMYLKITDEETSVTPERYLTSEKLTDTFEDVNEEVKEAIKDVLEELP